MEQPSAAPAPGTATREEFERLLEQYRVAIEAHWEARRRDKACAPGCQADEDAAHTALLQYEERLRERIGVLEVERDGAVKRGLMVLEAKEEATARVRALEKVLREIAAYNYDPGSTTSGEIARAALGVPTSAADEDGGAK